MSHAVLKSQNTKHATTLVDLFLQVRHHVDQLLQLSVWRETVQPLFARTMQRLKSLPIGSDEFSLARNRLHNAYRYSKNSEYGACRYELQMLARNLEALQALFA